MKPKVWQRPAGSAWSEWPQSTGLAPPCSFLRKSTLSLGLRSACLHETPGSSPLLSDKGDIELVPLELLPGIGHHLIEGSLQQVIPTNNEPEKKKGSWGVALKLGCGTGCLWVVKTRFTVSPCCLSSERGKGKIRPLLKTGRQGKRALIVGICHRTELLEDSFLSWGCDLVLGHLSGMCEVLGSIPSPGGAEKRFFFFL